MKSKTSDVGQWFIDGKFVRVGIAIAASGGDAENLQGFVEG